MSEVLERLYGPKPEKAPLPPVVTRTKTIWDVSSTHKYASQAYQDARNSKEAASKAYQAASRAEQTAYANLSEIETELEAMEKEAGLTSQTVFLTIESKIICGECGEKKAASEICDETASEPQCKECAAGFWDAMGDDPHGKGWES